MPRTLDVAKIASVNDQQSVTQQQQLSMHSKRTADEQQRQVQTTLSSHHDGKVTTEDLDHEKHKRHNQHEGRDDQENSDAHIETEKSGSHPKSPDSVLGHMIDIKT